MKPNLVLAFAVGAVLAAGMVYVAVKPAASPKVTPVSVTVSKPVPAQEASTPPPEEKPAPIPEIPKETAAAPPPEPEPPSASVQREKPLNKAAQKHVTYYPPQHKAPLNEPKPAAPAPPSNSTPQEVAVVQPQPAPVTPEPAPPAVTPEPPPPPAAAAAPPPPPVRVPNSVTIQPGTTLTVRVGESLSSRRNKSGDTFLATLDRPLIVNGFVIAEKGSRVQGRIIESDPGGRVQGLAHLTLQLDRLNTSDGQHVPINTASVVKNAQESRGTDAAKVGAGAALGAIIGAIAGGGKGAGIGAGAGGAAGAGDVLLTRGRPAQIPVETRLSFQIADPVTLTERLD